MVMRTHLAFAAPLVRLALGVHAGRLRRLRRDALVFLDEFGINLGMTRSHARAPRGERAHGSVPNDPRPTLTLTIGLGLEGIVAPFLHRGATTAESFRTYVEQCLAPVLSVGTVVVMDNVRAHHTAGVREAIEGVGARLVYLPPYSPDFSPVEHTGSKVKTLVRADEPRTIRAVIESLRRVFKRITPKDALGWFQYCRRCTNHERAPPYDNSVAVRTKCISVIPRRSVCTPRRPQFCSYQARPETAAVS
jgi:transposase